ncbi:MAG: hypothetical protein K6A96_15055 [Prevotella sp.]|nr:hypothetical protein [Prevotella sp.]
MKRNIVLAVIAIILLTFYLVTYAGPYALLMLLAIPLAYFLLRIREKTETTGVTYASVEEVEQKYGEPDDVVVLDASRANELPALILFYSANDVVVVAGEELKLSNLVSVMPKNMATPYTVDEYAVIISTNDPNRPIIQLRVGYDGGLAREIATQIDTHIRI